MNKLIIYTALFFLLLLFPPLFSLSQPSSKWEAGVRLIRFLNKKQPCAITI